MHLFKESQDKKKMYKAKGQEKIFTLRLFKQVAKSAKQGVKSLLLLHAWEKYL